MGAPCRCVGPQGRDDRRGAPLPLLAMRLGSKTETGALAVAAYGSFLASSPGRVSADSKQYLYLDPGAFLERALQLWDPQIGAGTVPHQQLGYAFPVGPWFWLLDRVGVPDWIAQRLWLGTLTLVALLGARWLFGLLGASRGGALVGALIYGFTPYQLAFVARMSVLLMPWAALPWLVGLTVRATRDRTWRAPALLALVLVLAGGINASSLLLVALAPAIWVVREMRGSDGARRAVGASLRIGLLAAGVSLWWLVGLRVQGAYGLPVLQLTENVRTVAEHSSPADVLRGLGNWFFYGRDGVGTSLDQTAAYEGRGLVVWLSYAIPALAIAAGLVLRWAHRSYFAVLVVVGTVVAVGAFPYDNPSPYGSAWKAFTSDTSVGLAVRNTPRAVPLILLGMAGLVAGLLSALHPRRLSRAGGAIVAVVVAAALLPVWQHGWLSSGFDRPEQIPAHWQDAGAAIDAGDHSTRVLEVPGASFAAHRWGNLVDPLTPGLTDRPHLAREVLPQGSAATSNLLDALDRRMLLGTFEPASLAPLARLLGVGTVVLRGDLDQSGRFDTGDPTQLWHGLEAAARMGELGPAQVFGRRLQHASSATAPPVALFDVVDPVPIVRVHPARSPVVVAGDGDGLVDAAAAGLIDGRGLVLQSGALSDADLQRSLASGAHLVLTDSNRRRIQTWFYALRDNKGPTERAGTRAPDPTGYDFRLDLFPEAGDAARTVVEHIGGTVDASSEGGPEHPELRGALAFDGDRRTAWMVGGADPRGESVTVVPDGRLQVDEVRLVQAAPLRDEGRTITKVRVVVNDAGPVEVSLGPESFTTGELVRIGATRVRSLRVEIVEVSPVPPGEAASLVGLSEVVVDGLTVHETVRLPTELLDRVGADLRGHGLDVVLTRLRRNLPGDGRQDEELRLDRTFSLPIPLTLQLTGTARAASGAGADVAARGCRSDLVEIDGVPVPVRVDPAASAGSEVGVVRSCGTVQLEAGRHRVVAVPGHRSGLHIDRVVLGSGPDGGGATPGVRGPTPTAGPRVVLVHDSPTSKRARIHSDGAPFWLVLGESHNSGWRATSGDAEVGERRLVDGYANGWLVRPSRPGPVEVSLEWPPQTLLPVGIAVSLATVVLCLVIVARARGVAWQAAGAPPHLRVPTWHEDVAPGRELVGAVALVALGSVLVAPLWVAGVSVALVIASARLPLGRLLLLVAAPAAVVAGGLLLRPSVAWVAVVLLIADSVMEARVTRRLAG